jgi:hypothetical protein
LQSWVLPANPFIGQGQTFPGNHQRDRHLRAIRHLLNALATIAKTTNRCSATRQLPGSPVRVMHFIAEIIVAKTLQVLLTSI